MCTFCAREVADLGLRKSCVWCKLILLLLSPPVRFFRCARDAVVAAACNIASHAGDDPCHGLADQNLLAKEFIDLPTIFHYGTHAIKLLHQKEIQFILCIEIDRYFHVLSGPRNCQFSYFL